MDHDNSYKLLFSHAELVADLLRGFIRADWVEELDFSTLERFGSSQVSDNLQERHDDLIWRVRWREQWVYLYLLLEFQASIDKYMALRILTYLALLQQALVRSKQLTPSGRLPPAFSVVLYNGQQRWTATQQVAELIEPVSEDLKAYQPQLRYWLLDIGRLAEADLPERKNLAAAVFQLENSRTPQAMREVLHALAQWLKAPEQMSLRRALTEWVRRVLMPARLPGVVLGEVNDLVEVESMLAERVMEWTQEWRQGGLEDGRKEIREAERALLVRQTNKRFGESYGQALAPLLEPIVDQEKFAQIGEWIVVCESGEALLAKVQDTK